MSKPSCDLPILEEAWMYLASSECSNYMHDDSATVFDLSEINAEHGLHECSIGQHFVDELLNEISSYDLEHGQTAVQDACKVVVDTELLDWDDYSCPSVVSTCNTLSSSASESSSTVSEDDGYVSLDQCAASLSDFLDPEDFSALLDTLSAALPCDALLLPVVLDDACYNLSQCTQIIPSLPSKAQTTPAHLLPTVEVSNQPKVANVKPDISYIELVAKAIMGSPDKSVLLSTIYQWIEDNYPYYKHTKNSWRNSIRHNLSVNECFVKNKRVKNGRRFYWGIHSSCIEAFERGDFDRRKARRQVQQCNRAFSSAFEELQDLQHRRDHYVPQQSRSMPPPDRQFEIGARSYTPASSTPVRSHMSTGYASYYGAYSTPQTIHSNHGY